MPQPAKGNGPWGEAIAYWLNARHWRQADLVRATNGGLSKNTISIAANGLDVNTETLRIIAAAFDVSIEDVLVSPDRKSANDARKQMILEITEQVTRQLEASMTSQRRPTEEQAFRAMEAVGDRMAEDQRRLPQHKTVSRRRKLKSGKRPAKRQR